MITWIHLGPSVAAAFLGSLVECVEAATIVLAVGTVRGWRSALAGTTAGVTVLAGLVGLLGPALAVTLAALALRRPLARVPENTLKFTVAVLLASFGTFWVVEGLGIPWPGGDLAILGLAAAFLSGSLLVVEMLRRHAGAMRRSRGAA